MTESNCVAISCSPAFRSSEASITSAYEWGLELMAVFLHRLILNLRRFEGGGQLISPSKCSRHLAFCETPPMCIIRPVGSMFDDDAERWARTALNADLRLFVRSWLAVVVGHFDKKWSNAMLQPTDRLIPSQSWSLSLSYYFYSVRFDVLLFFLLLFIWMALLQGR